MLLMRRLVEERDGLYVASATGACRCLRYYANSIAHLLPAGARVRSPILTLCLRRSLSRTPAPQDRRQIALEPALHRDAEFRALPEVAPDARVEYRIRYVLKLPAGHSPSAAPPRKPRAHVLRTVARGDLVRRRPGLPDPHRPVIPERRIPGHERLAIFDLRRPAAARRLEQQVASGPSYATCGRPCQLCAGSDF
jgi:hypothetical protein